MIISVFALNYGNPSVDEEVTNALYATQQLAVEAAIATANQVLNDNPDLAGWMVETEPADSDGNPIIMIKTLSGGEAEWWRVVEMSVHSGCSK